MRKIRVLVVDDSALVRKMVSDALSEDPDIEIAAVAANGKIAIQKVTQCSPDIISLDVEMPEMGGIETVKEIRKTHPKLPIIMFSALTERGGMATLEALGAGATDYVTKPTSADGGVAVRELIKERLVGKIKALVRFGSGSSSESQTLPSAARRAGIIAQPRIVAIGVSTGGPNALAEMLPMIPAGFKLPVVIVQHMPPVFTKALAERLDTKCKLRVHEAAQGMTIEPGNIYIAPGDYHMELRRVAARVEVLLQQGPQENSCRPSVDPLFRSAVQVYGAHVLALILTGMGQDGLRGCEHVHAAGGQILAQDRASSVVWGMPGFVAQAGLAEKVLPLSAIADEIVRRAW